MCQPIMPFIDTCVTKPCLYTNRQSSCFSCLNNICCSLRMTNQPASLTLGCHIMYRATHVDIDTLKSLLRHSNTHFPKMVGFISPNMCNDWLFILCKGQASPDTKDTFRVTKALRIRKFCKENIWPSRCTYYMTKNDMRYIFHWC